MFTESKPRQHTGKTNGQVQRTAKRSRERSTELQEPDLFLLAGKRPAGGGYRVVTLELTGMRQGHVGSTQTRVSDLSLDRRASRAAYVPLISSGV